MDPNRYRFKYGTIHSHELDSSDSDDEYIPEGHPSDSDSNHFENDSASDLGRTYNSEGGQQENTDDLNADETENNIAFEGNETFEDGELPENLLFQEGLDENDENSENSDAAEDEVLNTSQDNCITGFIKTQDEDGNFVYRFAFNGDHSNVSGEPPVIDLPPDDEDNTVEVVDFHGSRSSENWSTTAVVGEFQYPELHRPPIALDREGFQELSVEFDGEVQVPGPSQRLRIGRRPEHQPNEQPRRKARRRRKDYTPKKQPSKKPKRITVIQKPLKPTTHREATIGVGCPQEFATNIELETLCPVELSQQNLKDNLGPKLADVKLVFQEIIEIEALNGEGVTSTEIILHVSEIPGRSVLKITTEKPLTAEASVELGLRIHDSRAKRDINNILVIKYFYHCDLLGIPLSCFEKANQKRFNKSYMMLIEDSSSAEMKIGIYVIGTEVVGDHILSQIPIKKNSACMKVSDYFLKIPIIPSQVTLSSKEDIPWFYGQIRKYHEQENLPYLDTSTLQNQFLVPKLRSYQQDAVKWMLVREGLIPVHYNTQLQGVFRQKMYIRINLGNWSGYYNPFIGYFCSSTPQINELPSGGILADEMGLGKTVEILALILCHPKPGSQLRTQGLKEDDLNMATTESQDFEEDENTRRRKSQKLKRPLNISHPKLKTRSQSPCEFLRDKFSDTDKEVDMVEDSPSSSKMLVKSLFSSKKGNIRGRGRKRKTEDTEEIIIKKEKKVDSKEQQNEEKAATPGSSKQGVLLKQMLNLYSAALSGFDATADAKVKPKFYGKFYETSLDHRSFLECVCGGFREQGQLIVTCIKCTTSQHPKCVGEHLVDRPAHEYICPHCTVKEVLVEASSTLIITPGSISHQWISEIQRHIQMNGHSMNILFYKGVGKHGYIPPAKLTEYDIVITTYSVLQTELNYTDLPHNNSDEGRKFRNPKRFLAIPSPLPCVNWWRICLDEAQMVEGINTKMAMMAGRLRGIHKWCISGTPLNKGLQDLHGLFSFLGVSPIDDEYWWKNLVHDPFYRKETDVLYELFGRMIWRTCKSDVLDQLGIPSQTDRSHWLQFSAIESHFYKQQLETCSSNLLNKIARLDSGTSLNTKLSTLERKIIQSLLQPFLELRQACCHPQMVKGQLISLHKGTLTMEQLLEQLTKKTAVTCAEDHRLMVAAWNGLAGLYIIRKEMVDASEMYRKVLQSAEKYKEQFPTDTLQLLHTMENLADIIDGNYSGVPYTLRDDTLRSEVDQLRKKYLENYQHGVNNAVATLAPMTTYVEEVNDKFHCKKESWWYLVLTRAASISKIDDLITRIKSDLLENTDKKRRNTKSMANKFEDAFSLEHILVENLSGVQNCRNSVLESIEALKQVEPIVMVDGAVSCHLRNQSQLYYNDSANAKCNLCMYHETMIKYESKLFWEDSRTNISRTGRKWQQKKLMGALANDLSQEEQEMALMREEEELCESTEHVQLYAKAVEKSWQDSDTEKTIKILSNFARLNGSSVRVLEDGANHIKLYTAMKKEYKFIRIFFRQLFDQVSAVDELNQATTRMRLRYEGEESHSQAAPKKKKELSSGISQKLFKLLNVHVIDKSEIFTRMEQMNLDATSGQESLSLHFGQLMYLNSLKTKGYGKKGSFNKEECPVCQNALGTAWSVLPCGHSYCRECIKEIYHSTSVNFLCPLCRVSLKTSEISFVDTNEDESAIHSKASEPESKKEIVGSHSTKIEAVIVQLLKLQEIHPGEKVIVFSNWSDVLDILCGALNENEIKYCLLGTQGFQKDLKRFKSREDIQVLLMPLSFGAKGLNLIEATHVFLVEPILNKASELQAIGRVHRIGQTKPTFVHRFYVKNTIEEKLHEILKLHDVSSDEEGSLTVQDLKNIVSS